MFPYPLEDWGGANGIWAIIEVVKDFVSVPSRGSGGANVSEWFAFNTDFKTFPYPREDWGGSNEKKK